jgi:hypothetical protein
VQAAACERVSYDSLNYLISEMKLLLMREAASLAAPLEPNTGSAGEALSLETSIINRRVFEE